MRVTLLSDIFVFLLLCSAPGVAALTRSISLLVCVFVSVALPRRLFGAGRASCLQERDETRPVKHRGARPQMGTQPVLFALHFPPAPGAVGVHDFTPYFEMFFTSSNMRRPCSISLSTSGAMPRTAAFSNRLRRCLTRASRAALPFCQRSLASGLTRPSPPQKSHARSIGRHPRSLQAIPKPTFAPRQSGQITVNVAYLLFAPASPQGQGVRFAALPSRTIFRGQPLHQKLRGCTTIPLPARATCGRDKRRPGRVRLSGGALAVESAGHQWKRAERTAIRAALSGEDRATAASARRAGNRGGACDGAARSARQGCRDARWRHSAVSVGRRGGSSRLGRRLCLLLVSFV